MLGLEEVHLHLLGVSLPLTQLLSLQFETFEFGFGLGALCSYLVNFLVVRLPFFLRPFFLLAFSKLILSGDDDAAPGGARARGYFTTAAAGASARL